MQVMLDSVVASRLASGRILSVGRTVDDPKVGFLSSVAPAGAPL